MDFKIEYNLETDGRWIANRPRLPGVMAYGESRADSKSKVEALALCVLEEN